MEDEEQSLLDLIKANKGTGKGITKEIMGGATDALGSVMGHVGTGMGIVKDLGKSKRDRMNDDGVVTHDTDYMGNITGMAAAGGDIGKMLGPVGQLVGSLAGGVAGLGVSLFDDSKNPTFGDQVARRENKAMETNIQNLGAEDTFSKQQLMAANGLDVQGGAKPVEVERDELVLRKNGRAFTKVADFRGGKSHMQGGEDYMAQDGDIIIPKDKRNRVEKLLKQRRWSSIESIRRTLPTDTPGGPAPQMAQGSKGVYAEGTSGISTEPATGKDPKEKEKKLTKAQAAAKAKADARAARAKARAEAEAKKQEHIARERLRAFVDMHPNVTSRGAVSAYTNMFIEDPELRGRETAYSVQNLKDGKAPTDYKKNVLAWGKAQGHKEEEDIYKAYAEHNQLDRLGIGYQADPKKLGGGYGSLQTTFANYGGNSSQAAENYMKKNNLTREQFVELMKNPYEATKVGLELYYEKRGKPVDWDKYSTGRELRRAVINPKEVFEKKPNTMAGFEAEKKNRKIWEGYHADAQSKYYKAHPDEAPPKAETAMMAVENANANKPTVLPGRKPDESLKSLYSASGYGEDMGPEPYPTNQEILSPKENRNNPLMMEVPQYALGTSGISTGGSGGPVDPPTDGKKGDTTTPSLVQHYNIPGAMQGPRAETIASIIHRTATSGDFNPNASRLTVKHEGAQFTIDRDGTIHQVGKLGEKMYHAGPDWNGRAIGIEIAGKHMGGMDLRDKNNKFIGYEYPDKVGIWEDPTPEQLASAKRLVGYLKKAYPEMEILDHYTATLMESMGGRGKTEGYGKTLNEGTALNKVLMEYLESDEYKNAEADWEFAQSIEGNELTEDDFAPKLVVEGPKMLTAEEEQALIEAQSSTQSSSTSNAARVNEPWIASIEQRMKDEDAFSTDRKSNGMEPQTGSQTGITDPKKSEELSKTIETAKTSNNAEPVKEFIKKEETNIGSSIDPRKANYKRPTKEENPEIYKRAGEIYNKYTDRPVQKGTPEYDEAIGEIVDKGMRRQALDKDIASGNYDLEKDYGLITRGQGRGAEATAKAAEDSAGIRSALALSNPLLLGSAWDSDSALSSAVSGVNNLIGGIGDMAKRAWSPETMTEEQKANPWGIWEEEGPTQQVGAVGEEARNEVERARDFLAYGKWGLEGGDAGIAIMDVTRDLGMFINKVFGQSWSGSEMQNIMEILSTEDDEEIKKHLDDMYNQGVIGDRGYTLVNDIIKNPENYWSDQMSGALAADLMVSMANPKGIATVGKGVWNLSKAGAKGVKNSFKSGAMNQFFKAMKDAGFKGGAKKVWSKFKEQFKLGESSWSGFETVEDVEAAVDALNDLKKSAPAGETKFIDEMLGTAKKGLETIKKIPANIRPIVTGRNLDEWEAAGKSMAKLMGVEDIKALENFTPTEVVKQVQKLKLEQHSKISNAYDGVMDAKKAHAKAVDKLYDIEKNVNNMTDAEYNKARQAAMDEILEVGLEIEDKVAEVKKMESVEVNQAWEYIHKMEGIQDGAEYGADFRVVNKSQDIINKKLAHIEEISKSTKQTPTDAQKALEGDIKFLENWAAEGEQAIIKGDQIRAGEKAAVKAAEEGVKAADEVYDAAVTKFGATQDELAKLKELEKQYPGAMKILAKDAALWKDFKQGIKDIPKFANILRDRWGDTDRSIDPDTPTITDREGIDADGNVIPAAEAERGDVTGIDTGEMAASPLEDVPVEGVETVELTTPPNTDGEAGGEKSNLMGNISDGLSTLAKYAPAIYNLTKGMQPADKTKRNFIAPQTVDYKNMSGDMYRQIDEAMSASVANARNLSGGSQANFRANTEKAWAEKLGRVSQTNAMEAQRASQTAQSNIAQRNRASEYNARENSRADQMDMQSKAATERFFGQGVNDLANISARDRADKNMERSQQIALQQIVSSVPPELVSDQMWYAAFGEHKPGSKGAQGSKGALNQNPGGVLGIKNEEKTTTDAIMPGESQTDIMAKKEFVPSEATNTMVQNIQTPEEKRSNVLDVVGEAVKGFYGSEEPVDPVDPFVFEAGTDKYNR